jgi:uncharacterized protein (DUF2147 family)
MDGGRPSTTTAAPGVTMFNRFNLFARYLGLAATLFAVAAFVRPQLAWASESPVGTWKTIDDDSGEAKSLVKIYERDGKLYGKITKLFKNPDAKCEACDGDDKDAPINGMVIMWGLSQDDDEWSGGKIFDPKKGKTYKCKLWLDGSKLMVRGYAGPFFRTQTWHRID